MVCSELLTSNTSLASACKISTSSDFNEHKFPSRVEDFFDSWWDIDDLVGRYDLVVSVHVSVVELVEPETILSLPVRVHVGDSVQVLDVALASQGCERTGI